MEIIYAILLDMICFFVVYEIIRKRKPVRMLRILPFVEPKEIDLASLDETERMLDDFFAQYPNLGMYASDNKK